MRRRGEKEFTYVKIFYYNIYINIYIIIPQIRLSLVPHDSV